jgi:FkbM family methyltransferase
MRKLLFEVRGLSVSDELAYLLDLVAGIISRRLIRLKTYPGLFLFKDVIIYAKAKGSLFRVRARTDELFHVLPYYESDIQDIMEEIVKPFDVCVDVGAHIGTYAIYLSRLAGPEGLVVAFEPLLYKSLEYNVKLNKLSNIILIPEALGSIARCQELYYDPSKTGVSSLLQKWTTEEIEATGHNAVFSKEVNVVSLDKVIDEIGIGSKKIKVIKIDVEGAEVDVIKGSLNTLKKTEFLILEVSERTRNECQMILAGLGFKIHYIDVSKGARPHEVFNVLAFR